MERATLPPSSRVIAQWGANGELGKTWFHEFMDEFYLSGSDGRVFRADSLPDAIATQLRNCGWGAFRVYSDAERQAHDRKQQCLWYAWGIFDGLGLNIPTTRTFAWAERCYREALAFHREESTGLPSIQDMFTSEFGSITHPDNAETEVVA